MFSNCSASQVPPSLSGPSFFAPATHAAGILSSWSRPLRMSGESLSFASIFTVAAGSSAAATGRESPKPHRQRAAAAITLV